MIDKPVNVNSVIDRCVVSVIDYYFNHKNVLDMRNLLDNVCTMDVDNITCNTKIDSHRVLLVKGNIISVPTDTIVFDLKMKNTVYCYLYITNTNSFKIDIKWISGNEYSNEINNIIKDTVNEYLTHINQVSECSLPLITKNNIVYLISDINFIYQRQLNEKQYKVVTDILKDYTDAKHNIKNI